MKIKPNVFIILIILLPLFLIGQTSDKDKCGIYGLEKYSEELDLRGDHWGYGYDNLLSDLEKWDQSPYVKIDSMGASVQNRTLWELQITSPDTTQKKHIIYIHVRTHPGEVQSFWVANEIINLLLSEDSLAVKTREKCIYYIVPMYNPDGVELEYARENANQVDLESNWFAGNNVQPEVMALRNRFLSFMDSDKHIEIALNMHSAYKCKRYFVVHDLNGTSISYQIMEKAFVEGVRKYFFSGIEPWNFFVTWTSGTPLKYPESWWWVNYGSNVLALTYEDGNCDAAGYFDKTARAIVSGIADFLDIQGKTTNNINTEFSSFSFYPNPASNKLTIDFRSEFTGKINIYNSLGRQVLNKNIINLKKYTVDVSGFAPGIYFLKTIAPKFKVDQGQSIMFIKN